VQVGASGSSGVLEISDIIFSTQGPAPGAVVVEWNVQESSQGSAGIWDSYIRLGGAAGTKLQEPACAAGVDPSSCYAAFLGLHLTSGSSAYLEGTWVWLADHDLDGDGYTQLSLASGRGILSESAGPVWMIGTASEHHVMYQYGLIGAKNHYLGFIQTETPYFQPDPTPPTPFTTNSDYNDPTFSNSQSAWGLYVQSSSDILVFGAGHYSFYDNYSQDCLDTNSCQTQIVNTDSGSSISIYSLSTVGTTYQVSVGGQGIVNQNANVNGFASTITYWAP